MHDLNDSITAIICLHYEVVPLDINQNSSTPKALKAPKLAILFERPLSFAKEAFISASSGLITFLHAILQPQVELVQPNHVAFLKKI